MVGDGIRRYVTADQDHTTESNVTVECIHSEHVEAWLKWLTEVRNASEETLRAYARTLHSLVEFANDEPVSPSMIEAFSQRPRLRGQGGSASTVRRDVLAIRSFYGWACKRGLYEDNPSLDAATPPVPSSVPKAIADELWLTLWYGVMPDEDRAWLGLGYFAGLRRNEIASVPPRCFDTERELIVNFQRKGGSRYAVEYGAMADTVCDKLPWLSDGADQWRKTVRRLVEQRQDDRWLAPRTTKDGLGCGQWVNTRLRTLLGQVGVPRDAFSPHCLRHSCATNLLRAGVPIEIIADQLSHSSIETTRRYLATGGFLAQWRQQRR